VAAAFSSVIPIFLCRKAIRAAPSPVRRPGSPRFDAVIRCGVFDLRASDPGLPS
jgi:hypothetical protein